MDKYHKCHFYNVVLMSTACDNNNVVVNANACFIMYFLLEVSVHAPNNVILVQLGCNYVQNGYI